MIETLAMLTTDVNKTCTSPLVALLPNQYPMEAEVYGEEAWSNISKDFENLKSSIYLDHAGTTLYSQSQLKAAFGDLSSNCYGNPHSRSPSSRLTEDLVEQARVQALHFFRADPEEYQLIFTSGATASLKLVAESFAFNTTQTHGRPGSFVYLKESHTSVVGMRESSISRGISTFILTLDEAEELFKEGSDRSCWDREIEKEPIESSSGDRSLFAFAAQCNFSGYKHPLEWLEKVRRGALNGTSLYQLPQGSIGSVPSNREWFCLLDAASYVSTNALDLSRWKPDFVTLSFYKIMGFPTGLGALLIHRRATDALIKGPFFGGGTVQMYSTSKAAHVPRSELVQRFEDGTADFLSILCLRHGLEALKRSVGSMENVSRHTHQLAVRLRNALLRLRHSDGSAFAEVYAPAGDFGDRRRQGGIVAFNLKAAGGRYIGYAQVEKVLALFDINVRTGCFCNAAACQRYLRLNDADAERHFTAGHVCGDQIDLIDGRPTGAVRASFGYMSRRADVDRLVSVLSESFLDTAPPSNRTGESDTSVNVEMSSGPMLTGVCVYPVKSCAAFKPSGGWPITPAGLLHDRQWVVVDAAGAAQTQKRQSRLCLIQPTVDIEGRRLILRCDAGKQPPLILPLDRPPAQSNLSDSEASESGRRVTRVCTRTVAADDCGDEAAQWLSRALDKTGLRLLRYADRTDDTSLANDSAFLLVTRSSVRRILHQLPPAVLDSLGGQLSLDDFVDRFRPNLIVDGVDEFAEDNWVSVRVGSSLFRVTGPCSRCQMICVDPVTAERHQAPLQALVAARGKKMPLGVHMELVASLRSSDVLVWSGDLIHPLDRAFEKD